MNNSFKKVTNIDFIEEYLNKSMDEEDFYLLDILPKTVGNFDKYSQFEKKFQCNLKPIITKFYDCISKLWLYNNVQLYVPDKETPDSIDLEFYDKLKVKIIDCDDLNLLEKIVFNCMEFEIDAYLIFNDMEIVVFLREQSAASVATESNESLEFVKELSKKEGLHLYKSEPFDIGGE